MRNYVIGAVAAAMLGTAVPTSADPVRVSSGRLSGSDSSVTDFRLVTSAFVLTGVAFNDFEPPPHIACERCAPGEQLGVGSGFAGFEGVAVNDVPRDVEGSFVFRSGVVTLPALDGRSSAQVTRPFVFAGLLRDLQTQQALDLIGRGRATVFLSRTEDGAAWNATRTDYDFAAAAPVPEPATLLLIGTGLAGVVAAKRRRRTT